MSYRTLLLEQKGPIATVTLNRPAQLNALDRAMSRELLQLCDQLEEDSSVRAVIFTGTGRAFSAGGDIQDFMVKLAPLPVGDKEVAIRLPDLVTLRLKKLEKPTVAAVNGPAVGGGCCLAMACDVRIASESATLGVVFVRRGLSGADMGATFLLPRLVGAGWAAQLLFTGDIIDARHAERIGLVNQVVPAADLAQTAWALASRLAAGPPLALKMTKRALNRSIMAGLADHLDYEAAVQTYCFQTEDHQEGVRSFLEKREATFSGR